MKNFNAFVGAGLVLALVAIVSVPASSFAADYAYVNTSGDVSMFTASSAEVALRNAPNMDVHSGVILLNSTEDENLVGTSL